MQKNLAELVGKKLEMQSRATTVNEKDFTVDFVLSTGDIDRHGDIIEQTSWILDPFKTNPVFLEQHESDEFPLGKFTKLWFEADEKGQQRLMGTVQFAVQDYDRAAVAFALVKNGFMNTVSVGFIPHVVDYDEVRDCFILKNCELLEVSLVSVPANRMALVKAYGLETLESKHSIETIKKDIIDIKKSMERVIEDEPNAPTISNRKSARELLNKALRQFTK